MSVDGIRISGLRVGAIERSLGRGVLAIALTVPTLGHAQHHVFPKGGPLSGNPQAGLSQDTGARAIVGTGAVPRKGVAPTGANLEITPPLVMAQAAGSSAPSPAIGTISQASDEQVPALGEAQIAFLDALREARRIAAARPDDRLFRDRVREAVLRHPDVQGAIAAQVGAQGYTEEVRSVLRPQVLGQTDGGWRSLDPNRLFGVPERRYSSAGWGVSIRQLVYDFGAAESSIQSGEARERVAAARAEARRAELVLRAVQAAIEFDSARQQSALAAENVAARAAIARYVQERQHLGGGSVGDVLRAQARVADAQAVEVSAQTRVKAAIAGYREIFGTMPGDAMMDLTHVPSVSGAAVDLLGPRFATVRAASAAREAAQAELRSVTQRALPQLSFEGSFNRRDQIGDGWPGNDRSALFSFRYEFYTGGAAQARQAQAQSRLEQANYEYRAAILGFERFAEQAFAELAAADGLVMARVNAVDLAASSLRAVREQFAFRRGTLLDLLNAQEVLQAAGRDLIDAYAQQFLVAYRVLYVASQFDQHFGFAEGALGGGPSP